MKKRSALPLLKKKKLWMLVRKSIIFTLMLVMELSYIAVPFAYAVQNPPKDAAKEEKFSTLLTDTDPIGVDPYIGEGRGVKSVIPAITDLSVSNLSANTIIPSRVHKLAKENYRPNEEIKVVIENGLNKDFKTELVDAKGMKVALETTEVETGAAKVITVNQPSSFRPGKYTLRITDGKGGVSEQDFRWGVLAINPDKSIYAPNEQADLAIAVLDEVGEMVCDAQVELQITDPRGGMTSLSTDNGKVIVNKECLSHDFTLKPDYETNYKVGGVGVYKMLLKAQTKNGAYNISDSFEVRESVPFDVKRITATRIYPPNTYPVTMEITANQDFEGTVTETVPASFRIAKPGQKVLTEREEVDQAIAESASESAKPDSGDGDIQAPEPQAPQGPEEVAGISDSSVLGFNTVNNLTEVGSGDRALFGATIPGLGMPFSGPYPVTQEFGESLVHVHDHDLYEGFGMKGHDGIDFGMPIGTPLQAVDGGEVVLAGDGDYGTTVVIQHAWGKSYYGHLSAVNVKVGDQVIRGSTIALSGNSGISTGPHLHFGIKPEQNETGNGYYGKVDPAYYLGLKQSAGVVLAAATKVQPENYTTPVSTDIQVLTWKINVKKGDKIKIGYNYLAPRISPQFYTLGPATFTDKNGSEVFHEIRKWQIAADALDLKMKKGSFTKSTCTAPCTQAVTGVGFRPKAVIFTWTLQTTAGIAANQHMGMGFATSSSQERAVAFHSDDGEVTTADTCRIRSNTKAIVMLNTNCASAGGTEVIAQADFVSFDSDGFTLNWSTNNASAYIIHYTAIGGADVSNAKAGTFTLTTGTGSLGTTDPGFRPDFVMNIATFTEAVDTRTAVAKMSVGFATSSSKQGAVTLLAEEAGTADTCRQQRTDSFILLFTADCTAAQQDAIVSFTSMDSTGFTVNKSDAPAANTDIFYLALQGGQYDVGAFTQPTSKSPQSVTTGFKPSGLMTMSASTSATTAVLQDDALAIGGASASPSAIAITEGSIWSDDKDGATTENANMATNTTKVVFLSASPLTTGTPTAPIADADLDSFDPTGFTLNWTTADSTAREILYWAAGSVSATEEDYRWYKNANSVTPGVALEDENQATIIAKKNPYPRLRASMSVGGNGLNASTQAFKLQYAAAGAEAAVGGTDDWCNDTSGISCTSDWTVRRKITFNNAASATNLTNFPVLVKLDSSRIDYGKTNNGLDIRFVEAGNPNVVLPHEIESWNESGYSYVWVQVPQIDSVSTTDYIYMYYGNASATDGQSVAAVWSAYNNVYHLNQDPGGSAPQMTDAVGNNHGTTAGSMTSADQITGKVDGAIKGDNLNTKYVNLGNITALHGVNRLTMSGWMRKHALTSFAAFGKITTTCTDGVEILMTNSGDVEFQASNGTTTYGSVTLNDTNWHYVTMVYDGTLSGNANVLKGYIDGAPQTLSFTGTIPATLTSDATPIDIMNNGHTAGCGGAQDQDADEHRISLAAMSAGWVMADYLSTTDTFNTYGQEQPYTSGGTSTAGWTDVGDPWCNDTTGTPVICTTDWSSRKKITISNAASAANLTDFPVLVKLNSSRIDYSKTQNSGQDLRFVDPSNPNEVIPYEIESWNESGDSYVWVQVDLTANATSGYIWMYYGNASIADGQNITGTWNSNYLGVWHLNETSGNALDATTNNGDLTKNGSPLQNQTGKIGPAADFNNNFANSFSIADASSGHLDFTNGSFSYALWVNVDTDTADFQIPLWNGGDGSAGYDVEFNTSEAIAPGVSDGTNTVQSGTDGVLTYGAWIQIYVVVDRTNNLLRLYQNGAEIGSGTSIATVGSVDNALKFNIGGLDTGPAQYNFDGKIDETRVINGAMTADWIEAEYLTANDQMNTFGTEESQSTAAWRFKDNSSATNGSTIGSPLLSTSTSGNQMSYQETNAFVLNPSALAVGEKREWDFALDGTNTSARRTYYFRLVTADGTPLTSYTRYPTITVGVPNPKVMRGGKWFNYKSSQPFTF